MRPRRRVDAAGTPAYKYIYFFSSPLPKEERNSAAKGVWQPPRHMSK